MTWTEDMKARALASLQKWHGTPHRNRLAIVGVGIDCVHLVYEVLIDAGVLPKVKLGTYSTSDGMSGPSTKLQEVILRCVFGEWVEWGFEFGDIAVFRTGTRSAHCGLVTGDGYLWQSLANRCVTRSDLSLWRHEIDGAVRITQPGFRARPDMIDFGY